ncbi:MAG: hypothetical protein MUD01_26450 [Chloroflexaceae bacterium]|jgi:hypothetical protein|nr:hypothetical protein [Chloroflexaceae bacterium]
MIEKLGMGATQANPRTTTTFWPSERLFVLLVIVFALAITSAPFAFAYFSAPPDRYFTGVMYNIPDHNQYFGWMRDLVHMPLAANRLTAEPNEPALFHLLWLVVGRVGAMFGLEYGVAFGWLRIVAVILLLSSMWLFLRISVADMRQRWLAFVLFAFAGGMGIIWVFVKYLRDLPDAPFPFDIYTSEPNSFFMMLAFPHFSVALALIISKIGFTLYAQQRQQLRYAVLAGLCGTLIGLQHAYDLLTTYVVLGLFGLLIWWRDRRFPLFLGKTALIIAAFSVPPAAYLGYLVFTDPTWGQKLEQFDNAGAWTPGLLHLPILLGVPLLLALLAFRPRMLQSRSDAEILVGVWFLAHFPLVYLPVKFQIHLLLGWQVPMMILAAAAVLHHIWPWLQARRPRLALPLVTALLGLCFVTNIYILAWRFVDLGRYQQPFFLSQNEAAALGWLRTNTTNEDVVLGTLEINQHVPAWADSRAFLAHWAGTLDYFNKVEMTATVLSPSAPLDQRTAILQRFGVTYLIVREQDSPRAALEAASPMLGPVFSQGDVTIYHVTLPQ